EARSVAGIEVKDVDSARQAAFALRRRGAGAACVGTVGGDLLVFGTGELWVPHQGGGGLDATGGGDAVAAGGGAAAGRGWRPAGGGPLPGGGGPARVRRGGAEDDEDRRAGRAAAAGRGGAAAGGDGEGVGSIR